jgi:hypothetical protein
MSDEPNPAKAAVYLAVVILLVAMVAVAISVWFRASVSPTNDTIDTGNPQPVANVTAAKAKQIAIEAVRKREGWLGKADAPSLKTPLYQAYWFVNVWREPRTPENTREIVIDAYDGRLSTSSEAREP